MSAECGAPNCEAPRVGPVLEKWEPEGWEPTLTKPTLANFSVLVVWPNLLYPKSRNPKDPKTHILTWTPNPPYPNRKPGDGARPFGPTLRSLPRIRGHTQNGLACTPFYPAPDHPTPDSPPPDPPPPDRQKFRFLFFPLPPQFRSFCVSLGVFSWNFDGVFEAPGP